MKMDKEQQKAAKARLETGGTGSGARRREQQLGLGVKESKTGQGILVRHMTQLPDFNRMLPPTGNREAARRLRQKERRDAR